jgi:pimeloyl-ACP methyl ester carboxylesterase
VRQSFLLVSLLLVSCLPEERDGTVRTATAILDTGRVRVPGSSLFYEVAGAGDPVILLHGGNLDRRMWDAEFMGLRGRHRVIRYDARGYGRSGPADTVFRAHDDLLALMDTLRLPRAALVGLSLGGRIAIDFALAHPERVDRMVLAAPGISGGAWAEDGDTAWLVVARQAAEQKDSVAVALAWLGSAYIRTALRDSAMAHRVRQLVVEQAPFWGGIMRHGDLEQAAVPAAAERLPQLSAPILLVTGSDDTNFIQDVARAIGTHAPNVRRLELPGVGHMVNLEAPDAFLSAVLRFLSR